jgi:opacity protein-like surface antigen
MTNRFPLLACAAGLALLTTPLRAQERDKSPLDSSYVALKVTLGIGGSRIVRSDAANFGGVTVNVSDAVKQNDKLEVSYGLAAQYMMSLHRYFALGALLGVMSWQSTNANSDASRNLGFDIALVPQGRLPVTNTVELYIALPLGLTLDKWNEVESSTSIGNGQIAGVALQSNTAVGFTVSLLAGARVALLDGFGLFTEVGFAHRQFSHELTLSGSALGVSLPTTKVNADITLDQFAWNIGAFF